MASYYENEPRPLSLDEIVAGIPKDLAFELDGEPRVDISNIPLKALQVIVVEATPDFGDEIEDYLDNNGHMQKLYAQAEEYTKNRSSVPTELSQQIHMRRAVAVAAMLYDLEELIEFSEDDKKVQELAQVFELFPRRRHSAA